MCLIHDELIEVWWVILEVVKQSVAEDDLMVTVTINKKKKKEKREERGRRKRKKKKEAGLCRKRVPRWSLDAADDGERMTCWDRKRREQGLDLGSRDHSSSMSCHHRWQCLLRGAALLHCLASLDEKHHQGLALLLLQSWVLRQK